MIVWRTQLYRKIGTILAYYFPFKPAAKYVSAIPRWYSKTAHKQTKNNTHHSLSPFEHFFGCTFAFVTADYDICIVIAH